MAKTFFKRLGIVVLTLAIFALLYSYLAMVFMPKDREDFGGEKYYNYLGIEAEKKNTIDMLVCGNSDAYCGFSPMEFYKNTGTTSYVRAGARESLYAVEKTMKRTYKEQNFKYLVLDCDCIFDDDDPLSGSNIERFKPLVAPILLHSRWKELTFKDFITIPKPQKDLYKGYVLETKAYPYQKPSDYMTGNNEKTQKISKTATKHLKNILNWCNKRKIELIFVCMPSPSSWGLAKSKAVEEFANTNGISFFDLNYTTNDFNLDYSQIFKDAGNHLNLTGATQATRYLSTIFSNLYELPNHKSEEAFSAWNNDLETYNSIVSELL